MRKHESATYVAYVCLFNVGQDKRELVPGCIYSVSACFAKPDFVACDRNAGSAPRRTFSETTLPLASSCDDQEWSKGDENGVIVDYLHISTVLEVSLLIVSYM